MCTGAEVAALALAAGGTAVSMDAQSKAERERKQTLMQGIEEEAGIQDKANATTNEYVKETYDPTLRAANYETQAGDREKALGDLLAKQSSQGQGDVTAATTGAVSDSFTRAKAGATADASQRARTLTRLLSRSGATGGLFGQEALGGAEYASNMLGLGVDSRLAAGRTNARYGAAGAAGRDMALLGGLLSGASSAVGAGGRSQGYSGTQAPAPVETRTGF